MKRQASAITTQYATARVTLKFAKVVTLVCAICVAVPASVAQAQDWWASVSGGFRREAPVARLPAATAPSHLSAAPADQKLTHRDPAIAAGFDALLRPRYTRIVMISKDRNVIYEGYAENWLKKSTPLGLSISKSLTALAVGKALCSGAISSLQLRTDAILPALAGTSWGNATIEQILLMQSGSAEDGPAHTGWQTEPVAVEHRGIYSGRMTGDFIEMMRRHDARQFKPGEKYNYNNNDTLVLGFLIEAATGRKFPDFFNEMIWQPAGPQQGGAWIQNNSGQTSTYNGFSATPEDWLRIGHFVIESMRNPDDCFARYLMTAAKQMQRTHIPTRCYGYQTWSWCNEDNFLFVGYGGQYLVITPKRGVVMYVHQASNTNDAAMMALYQRALKLL